MTSEYQNIFDEFGIDLDLYDPQTSKMNEICDSLQFVALICEFEARYNIYISEEMLDYESTLHEFVSNIHGLIVDTKTR